jgi:hypothetical protein
MWHGSCSPFWGLSSASESRCSCSIEEKTGRGNPRPADRINKDKIAQNRERDLRLDVCRGAALIVIFIDHSARNPLADWTLHNFAFCDAAEVFVLISGMASYLAYGSKLDRAGFSGCAKAVGKRWLVIYVAHLGLFGLMSATVFTAARYLSHGDYLGYLHIKWLKERPTAAILAALSLRYLPMYLDILPLYLVLLGFAPGLIYLVKRDYRAALAASCAVYLLTWITQFNLRAGRGIGEWYFNPLAWQLLYVIGMVGCRFSRTVPNLIPWKRQWLALSVIMIVLGIISAQTGRLALPHIGLQLWPANKTFLAPLRILNVLALVYAFAYVVPSQAPALRSKFARPLLRCGQHSLSVYGIGVLLSCVAYIVITEAGEIRSLELLVNVVGIAAMCALAAILEARRESPIRTAPLALWRAPGNLRGRLAFAVGLVSLLPRDWCGYSRVLDSGVRNAVGRDPGWETGPDA